MTHLSLLGIGIGITVAAYAGGRTVFLRTRNALLNPVFLGTVTVIVTWLALGVTVDDYAPGKEVMTSLLGPATVALAVPLYRQRQRVWARLSGILVAIGAGSVVTIAAVIGVARGLGLDHMLVLCLAPKSVTTPIAIEIARLIGGNPALTTGLVVTTGMVGAMVGPGFLTLLRIDDPVARGVAVGTTSHATGTAQMLQEGETQGALSGVAMTVAAVFSAVIAPILIPWLVNLGD